MVITDGADQHSRLKLEDVLSSVQASQAQAYLVGFLDPKEDLIFRDGGKTATLVSGQEIDNPRYAFKRMAEESGAERYFPASGGELATVVRTISEDLRTQYTLGYYLSPSDHGNQYRRIEVKVRRKGLKVRARHGFRQSEEVELPVSAVPVRPIGPETIRQRTLPYEVKTERHGEQVIFREDFSDPASGWPQKPGFFVKANQYHLEQLRPKALNEGRVAANGPWWTDFQASLVVQLDEPAEDVRLEPDRAAIQPNFYSQHPAAGLVFRLNERGYYAFLISRAYAGGKIFFKVVKKGSNSTSTSDLSFWEQAWQPRRAEIRHKLGVICHGNLIQLQVDGVQVTEFHDDSFYDGLLGMVLFGAGHAVFDDLVAQSIVE